MEQKTESQSLLMKAKGIFSSPKIMTVLAGILLLTVLAAVFAINRTKAKEIEVRACILETPSGVNQTDLDDGGYTANFYINGNLAACAKFYSYNQDDPDGLPVSSLMTQVGDREYGEWNGYKEIKASFDVVPNNSAGGEEGAVALTRQNHIFLQNKEGESVGFDVYEVVGVAPKGTAEKLVNSIRYKAQIEREGDGWVDVKPDMAQLRKRQEENDKTQTETLPIPEIAKIGADFLSGLKDTGIDANAEYIHSEYTSRQYIGGSVFSFYISYMGKDETVYVVNLIQPIKNGKSGVWAVSGYRTAKPVNEEKIPYLTLEQAKQNAVLRYYQPDKKKYEYYNTEKLSRIVEAQYTRTPMIVDIVTESGYTDWQRVVYNGDTFTRYFVYKTADGAGKLYEQKVFDSAELRDIDNLTVLYLKLQEKLTMVTYYEWET